MYVAAPTKRAVSFSIVAVDLPLFHCPVSRFFGAVLTFVFLIMAVKPTVNGAVRCFLSFPVGV